MANPLEAYQGASARATADMDAIYQAMGTEFQTLQQAAQGPQLVPGTGKTSMQLITEAEGKLEAQRKTQQIAQSANWDHIQNVISQELATNFEQQRALQDRITQDSSVSLFDDPLQAVINAFTLPWDEQALGGLESRAEMLSDYSTRINAHVQNSAKTADAIKTSITDQNIAELKQVHANMAVQSAAEARIKALGNMADGVKSVLAMRSQEAQAYVQATQLQNADEERAFRRERAAEARKIYDLQMQEYADKNEAREAEKKAEAEQLRLVNLARGREGLAPVDVGRLKTIRATPAYAKQYDAWLQKGIELDSGVYAHGDTMLERAQYRELTGIRPRTPAQERIAEMEMEAAQTAKRMNPAVTDKAQLADIANKQFANDFKAGQQNIKPGSMFEAPSYEVFMEDPEISRSAFWQKYIVPKMAADPHFAKSAVSPQVIHSSLLEALKNNEIKLNVAQNIAATIFSKAVALNNEAHGFEAWAGEKQKFYGAKVKMYSVPGRAASDIGATLGQAGLVNVGAGLTYASTKMLADKRFEATSAAEWGAVLVSSIRAELGASLNLGKDPGPGYNPAVLESTRILERGKE